MSALVAGFVAVGLLAGVVVLTVAALLPGRGQQRARVALGLTLVLGAGALLAGAWWLNQPGFAGDPQVKLIDDGLFALIVLVLLAVAAVGLMLVRRGLR